MLLSLFHTWAVLQVFHWARMYKELNFCNFQKEYATLMAESEEELKSLLIKVKEESEKACLKLNIEKT